MIIIVGDAKAVNSFVVRSTILWNMVVPLGKTTLACNSSRMFYVTLDFALERSVVESTGLNANETGWKNTHVEGRSAPKEMLLLSGSSKV